jgi:hypothetical protein
MIGIQLTSGEQKEVWSKGFECYACHQSSGFARQCTRLFFEMKLQRSMSTDDESRTYECEHCRAENVITQPVGAWAFIDMRAQ